MRNAGGILMAIGAAVVVFAFTMDTTVYSSGTYIGGSYVGGGSTHNLGLMQQQMMILHTGLAAFLAGAFLFGSSSETSREVPNEEDWEDRQEVRRRALIAVGVVVVIVMAVIAAAALTDQGTEEQSFGVDNVSAENLVGNM